LDIGVFMRIKSLAATVALGSIVVLGGCQTTKGPEPAPVAKATESEAIAVAAPIAAPSAASTTLAANAPASCANPISSPPPKPAKGSDIAVNAVGKNLGRNIGRNLIAGLGGAVGGGIGQAVAGGIATEAIRTEQDLKGEWNATDGAITCGCSVSVSSGVNLTGRTVNKGKITNGTCTQPALLALASWELGHTFTGYDAPMVLKDAKGATLATVNRDGINYFSGTMVDGKPLVLWRRSGVDAQ
jgi:hypothetical protein